MDAKALAKSKRAHSQHHSKKHHPIQTSKAPSTGSVGASGTKKPSGKQIKEKSRHSQVSSSLPSNSDRYEEEYDLGSENPSQGGTSQPTDVIVPKSKGADYAHLIYEAKSQPLTNFSSGFPSFDDVFTDFNQGVGSLLSVRGESILSWIGDDNFIVDDKETASHEASFLSLDLHVLAEQLAKVDPSQRLFIEADLLPPDLKSDQGKTTSGDKSAILPDGHADQYCKDTSSDTCTTNHAVPNFTDEGSKSSTSQIKDELWQFGRTGQSTMLESAAELNVNSVANPQKKPSRFESTAAEAELDMLLNSFNETKFLDSSGFTSYASQEVVSTSLSEGISSDKLVPTFHLKKGPDLSKSALAANLDDNIDDLLKETSSVMNQNGASQSHEVNASLLDVMSSPSSVPTSRSKLLDDFDSWLDTI